MRNFIKNIERKTAKDLKKDIYYWYLCEKGSHDEKIKNLFSSLKNIVLPPMTNDLKAAIIDYIEKRNKYFEETIINRLRN